MRFASNLAARAAEAVLILILMEYALWGCHGHQQQGDAAGLNPYSNGICSMSLKYIISLFSIT